MTMILFADGKKIGEISEWTLTEGLQETKSVLGKEISIVVSKPRCEFTSPKPVNRRQLLWLIDGKTKWHLIETKIKDGTKVTAAVKEREKL